MKGALYVLGSKATQNTAILDWRFTGPYLESVLACSHQERPSVQNLVKTITHDFVIRLAEPSSEQSYFRRRRSSLTRPPSQL